MKKEHQRELVVAIVFFLVGAIFMAIPLNKTNQLNKVKSKKVFEILWNKYEWKTKRLRIYTDLIYNTREK